MTPKTEIPNFLARLDRHSDLIEEAYHSGFVQVSGEDEPAARALRIARVFTMRDQGQYGLTRTMRDLLNEHTQRQQRFAIGGNIVEEVERMEKLLFELEEAASQGKHVEGQRYSEDLCQSLFDIKDMISQDILQFDQVMSAKFSDVNTIEEKMRQNEHYLKRAEQLHVAVEQLNRNELHESFNSQLVDEAGRIYRRVIVQSISHWSSRLLSISKVFEEFMFSFREITKETRRMRAFNRFLKEGGQTKLEEAFSQSAEYPVMRRVLPARTETWLDVYSDRGRNALAEIVGDMKPLEQRKKQERHSGQRHQDNAPVSIEEDASLEDLGLFVFLSEVDKADGWISGFRWAETSPELRPSSFLEHLLTWSETECGDEHRVRYTEVDSTALNTANIAIADIEVCRTT